LNNKFISKLISEANGIAEWSNKEGKIDTYIDGVYYPTGWFYQKGNSENLKLKMMEMELSYKQLNKIYRQFSYVNLSKRISFEESIDIIIKATLDKVNSWVFHKGENDEKWTVVKPFN